MTGTNPQPTAAALDIDLDRRVFDMVSSTASVVDTTAPTRFVYRESGGVLWGEYVGDTVAIGRFCGVRTQGRIDISFVHRGHDAGTTTGTASSVISVDDEGALLLTEEFVAPDGNLHTSICREVVSA
ncbi:hypothetical protein ASE14_01555 [Agromyces sp. Root81]|uniref:hypothetical protein n=1 Tax=Agromyces sp. Root81 TaxID=1736601 RepID=UPI0006F79BD7|nr:hypothetical protein [Agromyces sp. Root81]KRC62546.1 hypothetical protein ASE14_01555 [Agromyces sp. Root81]